MSAPWRWRCRSTCAPGSRRETLRNFITTVRPVYRPGARRLHLPRDRLAGAPLYEAAHQPAGAAGGVYRQRPLYGELCSCGSFRSCSRIRSWRSTTACSVCGPIPAPTPIPARSPCRRRWRRTSAGRRSFWVRRPCPRCHCASISYGDTMEITFAGTQAETDTERDFFRFLVQRGHPRARGEQPLKSGAKGR